MVGSARLPAAGPGGILRCDVWCGAVRIKGFRSPWLAQQGCRLALRGRPGGYCGATVRPCGAVRIKGFRSPWLAQQGCPQRGRGGYCGATCGAVRCGLKGSAALGWLSKAARSGAGGCDIAVRIKGFRSPWLLSKGPQRGWGGYYGAVRCGLKGSAALGWLSKAARSGAGGGYCGAVRRGAVRCGAD